MTMSEESRHRLYRRLEDVLGPEEAATLMEHVPPVDASELVTSDVLRGEMALFRSEFRAEFAEFRGKIREEFADFRTEMRAEWTEFRGEMRQEFADFRAEMRTEWTEFRGEMRQEFAEFRGEIRTMVRDQTRTILLSLVGLQISAAGLVVAVSHLV